MLSREIVSEETTNLYFGKSKAARIRTQNLQRYLYRMAELKPTKLLLGEAPGYKGCGKTGIAFSSERILSENSFYKNQGFECLNQVEKLETEISATILWNELDQYAIKPLIWNIFPFHPHSHSNKRSNRTPNSQELEIGKKYLKELLNIYAIEKIIALGRKAELMIKDMGYSYAYVRHPANGGKKEFVRGLKAELK
jgi:uracil-DNA glycosylase